MGKKADRKIKDFASKARGDNFNDSDYDVRIVGEAVKEGVAV